MSEIEVVVCLLACFKMSAKTAWVVQVTCDPRTQRDTCVNSYGDCSTRQTNRFDLPIADSPHLTLHANLYK